MFHIIYRHQGTNQLSTYLTRLYGSIKVGLNFNLSDLLMVPLFAIEVILIQCNTWSSFTFLDVDKILYNTINSAIMKQDLNENK